MAHPRVPRPGVPRPVRRRLRNCRDARALPCAQAPPARAGASRRLGLRPPEALHHEALLRLVHPRDLRSRLPLWRAQPRQGTWLPGGPEAVTSRGSLCLLLHSHMPYVEGFGTWPFGEEWLFEAVAASYLRLLDVIADAPLTLTVTPVLADQLEAIRGGDPRKRFESFVRELRPLVHAEDAEGLEASGEPDLAAELRRAAGDYERAA